METPAFEFSSSDELAGFRLQRFEVLNWGTFDRHVWRLDPNGHNALLTGDIGSGKSTLVDALTTLLVPPQEITYNKAAGAEGRERNVTSYVRGFYKTEKDDSRFAARSVALREDDSYSVVLGAFHNQGFEQTVTLAQVFWMKENKSTPERLYVLSDRPLSIAKDFSGFGTDIADLKKRLRKNSAVQMFESFTKYAAEFRRRMAIESDQALDLFYQTVSMKSVGNLTEFVRVHMLHEPLIKDRLDHICRHFENLNQAHEAVLKAKKQVSLLEPLIADCDRCRAAEDAIAHLRRCRDALNVYFALKKSAFLEEKIKEWEADLEKLDDRLKQDQDTLDRLRREQVRLRQSIADNGGGRLESLAREMERAVEERGRRAQQEMEYRQLCSALKFEPASSLDAFHRNRQNAENEQGRVENERETLQKKKVDLQISLRALADQESQINKELMSLRQRPSNIPSPMLELRARLCETLSMEESDLPFVGELLQVKPAETAWEGALERVLHNVGLSLLVPEDAYGAVSRYVEKTHLKGRLVYFRVRAEERTRSEEIRDLRLLVHKVDIKSDSSFHDWIRQRLVRQFDYVCCDSLEEFQRQPKALTRQGQTKHVDGRHEKDDRHLLTDRSGYVLGWDNLSKIEALEQEYNRLAELAEKALADLSALDQSARRAESSRDTLRDLLRFKEFHDIDWRPLAKQIAELDEERKRLTDASDVLRQLQAALKGNEADLVKTELHVRKKRDERVLLDEKLRESKHQRDEVVSLAAQWPEAARAVLVPPLESLQQQALKEKQITLKNCDSCQTEMREWLQARLDAEVDKSKNAREKVVGQMERYKNEFPLETREVDASWESAAEFQDMLRRLRDEDLPRHEERFKQLLNEGTINEIVLFQNQLDKEQQEIREKISFINTSLKEIEYSSGTFIQLVSERTPDVEVRQFQQDLRACLGETLSASERELYNESKFLQVKALIDRFKGREGQADLDKKWTQKVTDVRQWFEFSVSERWKETGEEKEFYSDSSGKSGGQKEKLAYTILASALAYQFGLEWGVTRSRSFRFVMIDEAFGRGSDESARYGLELFKKLNLQLLIVTPLQKIHVIEDYVRSVHFVHNEDGRISKIRNLTIESFRREKAHYESAPLGQVKIDGI